MKKYLFLFLTLSLTMSSIFANTNLPVQTVRGVVMDKLNRSTLPGANVVLLNTQPVNGTVTDADGRFRFEKIPVGRVSLKITFIGYKDIVLSNLILNTGKELVLEVELEENVIQQKGVEIKATTDKTATLNKMASVSARSFTVEETERYAGSRNDVARMASNYAGMMGANDARNDIIIRGNSPLGLQWRLEGIDIPNPNHYGSPTSSGGPVCMINNNLLSNSDFMTGAFPAEYGNAFSGVFDLKMRSGNNEKHEFLGQVGFNGFELGAEGPISRKNGSSYLINYRYSTLSVMKALGFDFGTGTGIPFYQDGSFKFSFPRTPIGSISVFGLGGISDIKIWNSDKDTTTEKLDLYGTDGFDLTNGSDLAVLGLVHTIPVTKNAFLKSVISGSFHRFATEVDSLAPVSLNKTPWYRNDLVENDLNVLITYFQKFSAKNNMKSGISAKRQGFDLLEKYYFKEDLGLRNLSDFDGDSWLLRAFVQWQYRLNDKLSFNTGLHHQYYTFNKTTSTEPRAGLRWEYAAGHSLNFGYGLHSQLQPVSVYFRQSRQADGSFVMLNKDLPMLKSHHLVLGHDWSITEFLRLKTEAYYQYLFNAPVDGFKSSYYSMLNEGDNFGINPPDTLVADGSGRNIGLEITFEHFLNKGFYYLFTASVFDSRYKGSDEKDRNTAFNGNYILNGLIGKEFTIKSKKDVQQTLGFDIKTTWAGGKRYIPFTTYADPSGSNTYIQDFNEEKAFTSRYRDYSRTDFKITWRRNGKRITQEWAVEAQNIFDQQNIYGEQFNKQTGEKSYIYQMGRLVVPQYRIIF